ncbi:unnamed protein product [Closterium sp. NIES-54]
MAKGGQQQCVVCQSQTAKYKCPTCLSPYCSVACCRKHKETPCQPREQPATSGAEAGATTAATEEARGSAGPGSSNSSRGKQPVRPFEECEDEDELSWRLPCSTLREIAPAAAAALIPPPNHPPFPPHLPHHFAPFLPHPPLPLRLRLPHPQQQFRSG